jgi:hypothetical protein
VIGFEHLGRIVLFSEDEHPEPRQYETVLFLVVVNDVASVLALDDAFYPKGAEQIDFIKLRECVFLCHALRMTVVQSVGKGRLRHTGSYDTYDADPD